MNDMKAFNKPRAHPGVEPTSREVQDDAPEITASLSPLIAVRPNLMHRS